MIQRLAILATLLAPLLATPALATPAFDGDDLLQNGGFEREGGAAVDGWMTIWPRQIQDPAPDFARSEAGPRSGEACATLATSKPGGYSSFTQEVRADSKADVVTLRGWARVDEVAAGAGASFLLLFLDGAGESLGMQQSRTLGAVCDWTELELEALVPAGATRWMVRCGVTGQARVAFDDVTLVAERARGEFAPAKLVVHHGTYVLRAPQKCKAPWISLSLPFPFERQSPLALKVSTDPPEQVARLEVLDEGENRPLRVVLAPQERGSEVKLLVETLAMVSDRPLSDGAGVALVDLRKAPRGVRRFVGAAPGIDAEEEFVREAAETFERADLATLMRDLSKFLREKLEYSGGGSQGAKECLERGEAVCTGYANVATSLLIAAGVPTRILASTQTSGRLQEHYIVEVWTEELGWSRAESTMARFPWADSENLILRVVGPKAWRSPGDVPLFVETGGGATGGFDMDPADTCWQGAETLGAQLVAAEGFEALEGSARKAFEQLVKRPSREPRVSFLPEARALEKLKLDERTARLLERARTWLESE